MPCGLPDPPTLHADSHARAKAPDFTIRLLKRLLAAIGFAGVLYAALAVRIHAYGSARPSCTADAAVVLGAAVREGQPSPVFRDRIEHAIHLFRMGEVRFLIFTGGVPQDSRLAESEVAKRYAVERSVPENRIQTETRSHNTYQNLYYASREASAAGLTDLLVVSDPYHLRRALTMAHDLGLRATPSPAPNSRLNTLAFLLAETWRDARYHFRRLFSSDGGEMQPHRH